MEKKKRKRSPLAFLAGLLMLGGALAMGAGAAAASGWLMFGGIGAAVIGVALLWLL